jgi:hypothetical protein
MRPVPVVTPDTLRAFARDHLDPAELETLRRRQLQLLTPIAERFPAASAISDAERLVRFFTSNTFTRVVGPSAQDTSSLRREAATVAGKRVRLDRRHAAQFEAVEEQPTVLRAAPASRSGGTAEHLCGWSAITRCRFHRRLAASLSAEREGCTTEPGCPRADPMQPRAGTSPLATRSL